MKTTFRAAISFLSCAMLHQIAVGLTIENENHLQKVGVVFVKDYIELNAKQESEAIILIHNEDSLVNAHDFLWAEKEGSAKKTAKTMLKKRFDLDLRDYDYKTIDINSKRIFFVNLPDSVQGSVGTRYLEQRLKALNSSYPPVAAVSKEHFLERISQNQYVNSNTAMSSRTKEIPLEFSSSTTCLVNENIDIFKNVLRDIFVVENP